MTGDFRGQQVAVVGAGVEGKSSAKWLKNHGANVTVLDQKESNNYLKDLDQYDLVVRSPGVKRRIIEQALPKDSKTEITSQTNLFFRLCPAKIIGVTGTKGKGTTATLIYEMLKKSGRNVYLGGNIGKPPFEFLDKLTTDSIAVLELSSFQLQDVTHSPHVGVVLMITREHLDYHTDVYEYVDAKRNLLKFQSSKDYAVINRDYPSSNESDVHTRGKVFQVSRERDCGEGCFIKNGKVVVRILGKLGKSENLIVRQFDSQRNRSSESSEFSEIEIIDTKDILLPGNHNLENVCAAVMAAMLCGIEKKYIVSVLKTFKGLEHRLELVAEVNGVKYYDDSFSTTPETAIAAIQAFKQPEVLILGGSSKGSNFSQLGEVIYKSENIRAIIGIGVEWERIKERIMNHESGIMVVEGAKTMEQIVVAASKVARPGDVVLLTPACASFDMFKNYKDRGEQFKHEVLKLRMP